MKFAKYPNARRCAGCGDWTEGAKHCPTCKAEAVDPNMTASQALGHMSELYPGRAFFVGVTATGLASVGFCTADAIKQWTGETFAAAVAAARKDAGK